MIYTIIARQNVKIPGQMDQSLDPWTNSQIPATTWFSRYPYKLRQYIVGKISTSNQLLGKYDLYHNALLCVIMQAAHPRVLIALLQLGIGVQLHHHFASKFVINSFNKHGFRCSYQEVTKLERNAAKVHGTDLPCQNDSPRFVQYSADNVDHNIRTLDRNGTFHGMGIIASVTPERTLPIKIYPRLVKFLLGSTRD